MMVLDVQSQFVCLVTCRRRDFCEGWLVLWKREEGLMQMAGLAVFVVFQKDHLEILIDNLEALSRPRAHFEVPLNMFDLLLQFAGNVIRHEVSSFWIAMEWQVRRRRGVDYNWR